MGKYLKKFETHIEYEAYTADTSSFIKPNVSYCVDTPSEIYYNPLRCDETSEYEIVGTPSYPSTIDGADTSFDIIVNYRRTDTDLYCQETVTEGTDHITVECGSNPSTASSRTVSGTVEWNGIEIPYSLTQSKFEEKVTAKFNVTSTTNTTKIVNGTNNFNKIEIDGVEQAVTTVYTFSTLGEHTVKYTLVDQTSINTSAFTNCLRLTSITIPDSVTSIGDYAFRDCTGLTSINIPSGVTSIGTQAFSQCRSLTSINIPSGVTSIGNGAFTYCSGLTSIDIPDSVTSIGTQAFQDCRGLTSIDIPDSVTSIGQSAFQYCTSLTSIDIPNSVTSIGGQAFFNCSGLTSCTIGGGVTSIGNRAFYNCSSLTSITVDVNNGNYSSEDGILFDKSKTTLIQYPMGKSETSYTIPDSVTSIGDYAFKYCSSLTSINIPSGVTSIGGQAFFSATSLTSIDIPDSVTSIGSQAFRYCSGITSITSNATTAPTIQSNTFREIRTNGTLYVPIGSSGYDVWMGTGNYYLGKYNWTKVEQ